MSATCRWPKPTRCQNQTVAEVAVRSSARPLTVLEQLHEPVVIGLGHVESGLGSLAPSPCGSSPALRLGRLHIAKLEGYLGQFRDRPDRVPLFRQTSNRSRG